MLATLTPVANQVSAGTNLFASDLDSVERILTATFAEYPGPLAPVVAYLKNYRGKRLRPLLVLAAAEASGGINAHHHTLAAAVELVHSATLLHDDVIDHADTRRHTLTVNAQWGNKVAILLGDLLFTHAFTLTSSVDARACRIIGEASNRVVAGELRQALARGNVQRSERDYFHAIEGKTAALTECSMRLGAMYAGADEKIADKLAMYGHYLGLAFQVADDLLDIVGLEYMVGKTLGTDLAEQNWTLPVIDALNVLPVADAEELRKELVKETVDCEKVRNVLTRCGALERTQQRAKDLVTKAKQCLASLPNSDAKRLLACMAEWSIQREA